MKKTMWVSGIAALTVVLSVATGAQAPQATDSAKGQASKDTITITGCLQPDQPAAAASSAGTSEQFVLANAQKGSSRPSGSPASPAGGTGAPTGTAGSASSMSSVSYLVEGDSAELKKHLGHQIEVTGVLDSSSAPTSPASSSSAAGKQKVHVNSVRMISASCSAK